MTVSSRRASKSDTYQAGCVHANVVSQARASLKDDGTYVGLSELFGALSDSTRAKIVHMLLRQELCTCDIAAILGVTDSCVSQHLRILRSLRLVKSWREGKFVYHSLDDAHIALLVQVGLTHQGHDAEPALAVAPVPLPLEEVR
jgi:DNA-binding transcriptional ArsR family regulator